MRAIVLTVLMGFVLTACANGNAPLHSVRSASEGPDEFAVLPLRPLEMPDNLSLPTPVTAVSNRADPNPQADAIAVLGGRASAVRAGSIPARDQALITRTSRMGIQSDIRAVLAAEDATVRRNARRLSFLSVLGGDKYFRAYARQALDAYSELARFRALGVATPTAPPANQ